jgi:signal transduction histidine kinase
MEDVFSLVKKYDDIIAARKLEENFAEVNNLKNEMEYSFLMKEIAKLMEGIEDGAERSGRIVKGLRSFSRLDEEQCQMYQIHEGIDSTLVLLHNKMKNKIKVRKEYGDIGEIECFPGKLNQVFMNVFTNSIQAMEDGGELYIQTLASGSGIKVFIRDNGSGMSPEVKKHIFDPFYTTKDVGKGTGLGLSISYGIIEQHHGTIEVISEPGKGSEFIIILPGTQAERN